MPEKLHIYNSLTKKKELFTPLHAPHVGMYVCGPTVYNEVHLGNVRTFITFDMVYRYLKHLGYKVRYVRNITDVGHQSDDTGEDKMEKRAKLENLEPMEIACKYTYLFHDVMNVFNALPPSIEPSAGGHIIEQVSIIEQIMNNGFAYEKNGSVYFDVVEYNKKHKYGILSGRNIEDQEESGRELDNQDEKKNKVDFALWKKAERGHIMKWPSPWSIGYPGWHIECSAMSTKYLGETFDIHGGGMDLKFPHHECEIAQNVGSIGKEPVRYWMHSNMLNFEGQKMSKSKNNSILPRELISGDHPLLEKGYSPMVIRLFFLSSHYTSEVDISNKALQDAEKNFKKLTQALENIYKIKTSSEVADKETESQIVQLCKECEEEMNDDFNTATTLTKLYALSSIVNRLALNEAGTLSEKIHTLLNSTLNAYFFDVLGLKSESGTEENKALDKVMGLVIDIRKKARENKDWSTSDLIRDQLKEANILLKDGKEGTTYEVL